MASKKSAQDLLAGLDDLPDDTQPLGDASTTTDATQASTTANVASGATPAAGDDDEANINEFLAEFSRDRPSRPHTPRTAASKNGVESARASPRMSGEAKRPAKPSRFSGEGSVTLPADKTASAISTKTAEESAQPAAATSSGGNSWGSWGGSLWSTASAIATQTRLEAEKRLAELQKSEEAQKLQARLHSLDLAKLAQEARTIGQGVLDAVAPPIAGAEILVVHVAHDLQGVRVRRPVEEAFERVMEQVEGGHLSVLAKDLPRPEETGISLEVTQGGLQDARKLCEASVEDLARDTADQEETKKGDTSSIAPAASHIYLAVQAFTVDAVAGQDEKTVQLLLTLTDTANKIQFTTVSQGVPVSWLTLAATTIEAEIQPAEWVAEAIERGLGLAASVLAQQYVARRMGIDESKTVPGTPRPGQSEGEKDKEKETRKLASKQPTEVGESGLGL